MNLTKEAISAMELSELCYLSQKLKHAIVEDQENEELKKTLEFIEIERKRKKYKNLSYDVEMMGPNCSQKLLNDLNNLKEELFSLGIPSSEMETTFKRQLLFIR